MRVWVDGWIAQDAVDKLREALVEAEQQHRASLQEELETQRRLLDSRHKTLVAEKDEVGGVGQDFAQLCSAQLSSGTHSHSLTL